MPFRSTVPRALAALLALAVAGGGAGAAAGETDAATGRRILVDNCARCHAIDKAGDSPLAAAPPFRTLHRKYPVDDLAEALAEGITTGHEAMPEFVFSADEIAAILAYLDSIADSGPSALNPPGERRR